MGKNARNMLYAVASATIWHCGNTRRAARYMRVINVCMVTMATELDYVSVLEVAGGLSSGCERRGHMRPLSLVGVGREA